MNALRCGCLALATALIPPVLVAWQSTPQALQASGIARTDRFRDQVPRTGFLQTQLPELEIAATELEASYRGFMAASNSAQAGWSLVKLADCERWQVQMHGRDPQAEALAKSSRDHYLEAAALTRKTGSAAYLVKALLGLALVETTYLPDYGSAYSRVTEALRAAASCPDRGCLAEALEAKVVVEKDRGELFSAGSRVNGLLALLQNIPDPLQHFYAYWDRAAIYREMAGSCPTSFQKSLETCFRLFDLDGADMAKARDIAAQAGFTYMANMAASQIEEVDTLRS